MRLVSRMVLMIGARHGSVPGVNTAPIVHDRQADAVRTYIVDGTDD